MKKRTSIFQGILLIFLLFVVGCQPSAIKETPVSHSREEQQEGTTIIPDSSVHADTTNNYVLLQYASRLTEDHYYRLLDSIKQGLSNDFLTLRLAYAKTGLYHPYETSSTTFFYNMRQIAEAGHYETARDSLLAFAESHFVNPTVHLYLGYVYKQLNDKPHSEYYYSIYEALMQSLIQSGNGRKPQTAFIVITAKEEYELLNYFNMNSSMQSLLQADGHRFDMLKATDNKTGKEYEIYFNIDLPFNTLNKMFSH